MIILYNNICISPRCLGDFGGMQPTAAAMGQMPQMPGDGQPYRLI